MKGILKTLINLGLLSLLTLILAQSTSAAPATGILQLTANNGTAHYSIAGTEGDFGCTSGSASINIALNSTCSTDECRQYLVCSNASVDYSILSANIANLSVFQSCVNDKLNLTADVVQLRGEKQQAETNLQTAYKDKINLEAENKKLASENTTYMILILALMIGLVIIVISRYFPHMINKGRDFSG